MIESLIQFRTPISEYLSEYFRRKKKEFSSINKWGPDVANRLDEFVQRGKMLRGSLVLFSIRMFKDEISEDDLRVAAALELYQSGLLIHDDIIDRDDLRRGKQTIHKQYETYAKTDVILEPEHFGLSMGICTGDITFFLAYELLASLEYLAPIRRRIIYECSKELAYVGLAEIEDVYFGLSKTDPTSEAILNMYLHKTARYTFSLPLTLGSIITSQTESTILSLQKLGEQMGILFQIRDDELGLYGDEKQIGKSKGADIKEDKKTLYSLFLFHDADESEKKRLKTIFGKPTLTDSDIEFVHTTIQRLQIDKRIQEKKQQLADASEKLIDMLPATDKMKDDLKQFLVYNLVRSV